jgi:hypothetical protein
VVEGELEEDAIDGEPLSTSAAPVIKLTGYGGESSKR